VGAEGTLGVITELTLRLYPQPEAISAASCAFETIQGAVETAIETIQLGVGVARIEFLDAEQLDACNRFSKRNLPVAPTLLFEFHGDSVRSVTDQAETVQEITKDHGGHAFQWFATTEDREALWKMRHEVLYAALATRRGGKAFATDICVPISRLAECIIESKKEAEKVSFPAMVVGHVGDGNFHMNLILDPNNPAELEEALQLEDSMILRALSMGGTCSGEHGIGYPRRKYLEAEHGAAVDVMRAIKFALDPENRMNPGKIVDPRPLFGDL
jgi:D-lactate dehydrogenase (cytochrome)